MLSSSLSENAQKWVRALRSGLFQQGKGQLRAGSLGEKSDRLCCLGVACELAILDGVQVSLVKRTDGEYSYNGSTGLLPEPVVNWLGLNTNDGSFDDYVDGYTCLTELNDSADYSFNQIADLVEENPDGLFHYGPTERY